MKRLFFVLCASMVFLLCFCCPAWAADDTTSGSSSSSSSSSENTGTDDWGEGVGRDDLDGASDIIGSSDDIIDGVYDNMPEQSGGLLSFLSASMEWIPSPVILAICLSLILSLVHVIVRFMFLGG